MNLLFTGNLDDYIGKPRVLFQIRLESFRPALVNIIGDWKE